MSRQRRAPDEGSVFGRRRRLVLFLGIAAFLLGGAVGSEIATAAGAVTALSTVLVWSYVGAAIDRVAGLRTTLGRWRLRLRTRRGDREAETDGKRRAVERLQRRYAEDELTEREFEEQMELVLETDDEEVAELLVETEK